MNNQTRAQQEIQTDLGCMIASLRSFNLTLPMGELRSSVTATVNQMELLARKLDTARKFRHLTLAEARERIKDCHVSDFFPLQERIRQLQAAQVSGLLSRFWAWVKTA